MTTAERVARRYLAAKTSAQKTHFKIDRRKLKDLNDPERWEEDAKHLGGYYKYRIALIPIKDIRLPKVWNPGRYEEAKRHILKGTPLDPIDVGKHGGKWDIQDGIHRTNVSKDLGYTHVPAFVSTWVKTPEKYQPPVAEKPQLGVGDWVKMHKPWGRGFLYGWVDEYLGPRVDRGVKRHWYGLKFKDEKGNLDWGDFGDTEFEPARPPSWALKARDGVS